MRSRKHLLLATTLAALAHVASPLAAEEAHSPQALRASYAELRHALEHSPFGKPLHLASTQTADRLKGDVHAVIDQPFDVVRDGLADVHHWCDILVLHPNVTGCRVPRAGEGGDASAIVVYVSKRHTPVQFSYRVATANAEYLDVRLAAADGPVGTHDYRIELEATPLDATRTYLRLVYSHAYGLQARMAMGAYLGTLGRGKVGFTVVGRDAEGRPTYVGDLRGALERNAMRYYMCIAAYLQSLSAPPGKRFETRLRHWYAFAEQYPQQLHEDREYLDLKRQLAAAH